MALALIAIGVIFVLILLGLDYYDRREERRRFEQIVRRP